MASRHNGTFTNNQTMKLLFLSLILPCVSAGVITGFTDVKQLGAAGNSRTKPSETLPIASWGARGHFEVNLVPYANTKKNGPVTDIVELVWKNADREKFSLDMMTVNWPVGKHTLASVKPSIEPEDVDLSVGRITVYFHKASSAVKRTYNYDFDKNIYTPS